MDVHYLRKEPDGSYIDLGRNWRIPGVYGRALHYTGEAAEVMELVLKYNKEKDDGK